MSPVVGDGGLNVGHVEETAIAVQPDVSVRVGMTT